MLAHVIDSNRGMPIERCPLAKKYRLDRHLLLRTWLAIMMRECIFCNYVPIRCIASGTEKKTPISWSNQQPLINRVGNLSYCI